jgi:SET domain-containing protein
MKQPLVIRQFPGMGRGLCCEIMIKRGAIVEVSPVIPLTAAEYRLVKRTVLDAYVFAWGSSGRQAAVAMGFGGLFNHSDDPNVTFTLNAKARSITFRARREIPAGEQLTIDYMWTKADRRKFFGEE